MVKQSSLIIKTIAFCLCVAGCKNEKQAIISSIAELGIYEPGNDSWDDNSISPQWKNYLKFSQLFSENELIELCEHKSPVVRCYAFKDLVEKHNSRVYEILLKHLSDTSSLIYKGGCIKGLETVRDNYLEQVEYNELHKISLGLRDEEQYYLTPKQYGIIDSIVLFKDEFKERTPVGYLKYESGEFMLRHLKPLPEFHDRIKQIVNEGVYEALLILAQYKNPGDTAIFKKMLLFDKPRVKGCSLCSQDVKAIVLASITYFPHPSFYPILKEKALAEIQGNTVPDYDESIQLYSALAQYPTIETRKLLETAFNKSDSGFGTRSWFISKAIHQYPSKIFDGLLDGVRM